MTAGKVKISIFNGLVLNDVLVMSKSADTLFTGEAINISLRKNLLYLLNNELDLSYIGFKGIHINAITELGENKSNIDKFIASLSSSKSSSSGGKPINVQLKEIDLSDILFYQNNKNNGKSNKVMLRGGNIDINYMDWECNDFDFNKIVLDKPFFENVIYEYDCTITDELAIPTNDNTTEEIKDEGQELSVTLRELIIKDGYFSKENQLLVPLEKYKKNLDYANFSFENIDLHVQNIAFRQKDGLYLDLKSLSASDNTGYPIHNISCDSITIKTTGIALPNYNLRVGKSSLRNKLSLSYLDLGSFSDFTNKVIINTTFENSIIYFEDLQHFVKSIGNNTFIQNNYEEYVALNGKYYGKISNLAGRDVDIRISDKLYIAGSFNTRNLLDRDNAVLNIKLEKFQTSMKKIRMIIPTFNLPPNYNKLGYINFQGRFDGYLEDFVAYGKLNTDLGSAEVDMRLDITEGTNGANYSGNLNLQNFNLGIWSDNKDLGLVNFKSKVVNGKGLTLNTVKAELTAAVNTLTYKNYLYKDFKIDGIIDKNTFKGGFKIEDKNINLIFDGSFEYLDNKAFLNFTSNVKNLDLYALNISKTPLSFQGNMDINTVGNNINEFTGNVNLKDIKILVKDSSYSLAQINLTSKETINKAKKLEINSDLGTIELEGMYNIQQVVPSMKKVINYNYPNITKSWKTDNRNFAENQLFDFNINLKESRNFLSLIGLNDSDFKKLNLKGRLDTYKNELSIASTLPYFRLKNDSINNLQLLVSSNNKTGDILLHIDSTYALGRKFNPIDVHTKLYGDTIDFVLVTEKIIDSLENFDIKGRLLPHPKGYSLSLEDNLLVMLGARWYLNPQNSVVLGDKYVQIKNMSIYDGTRTIALTDINNNKGINIDISEFNLDMINPIIKYDKMSFEGITHINAKINDIYAEEKEISGFIQVPKFTINGDPFGAIHIDIAKALNSPIKANVSIGDFLAVSASYDEKAKSLDSKIKLRKAPLGILQYILKEGISGTEGYLDGDGTFGGPLDDLKIDGLGVVHNGKTKIKYTGATYFFDNQKVGISNTAIDLDGAVLTDENGNKGFVRGGLVHDMFRKFGVNASITGTNVIALNTTKADNPDYYGFGVGNVTAEFTGLFDLLNMRITAVTGPGSRLNIPVGNTQDKIDQSFIKFVHKANFKNEDKDRNYILKGINVEMALTLTPDATVRIIFDETKGDIIEGTGRGNMKIDITRLGDFEIFGDYEIEQGQYLFTVALLPVAKPFVVERGGTIRWTGDPLNTTLDITTNYRARTAVKPFIEEYLTLASPTAQRLAEQNTEVDLQLKLSGTLFKPEINFDLSFPNLTSDLANYTDSKLRLLRSNKLELNSQVLGLIVFKSFLPSNRVSDAFGTAGLQSAGINTLSEFLSSQLSMYLTNVLNSALEKNNTLGSIITGFDFDLDMRKNSISSLSTATNTTLFPDEIEIMIQNKFKFLDERLSLNYGGNYVFQNQGLAVNQILPDFALELILTDDKKLKIRLYGKGVLDPINNVSLRPRYGLGVTYRTEFGKMLDFGDDINTAKVDSTRTVPN